MVAFTDEGPGEAANLTLSMLPSKYTKVTLIVEDPMKALHQIYECVLCNEKSIVKE